jgi:carbon starvation protein
VFGDALAAGKVLAPARSLPEMSRVIFNDYVDATLAAVFAAIVVAMVVFGILHCRRAMGTPKSTAIEIGGLAAAGDD